MAVEVVRLQAKKIRGTYDQYFVTVPSSFVRHLGLEKGQPLIARILEVEVEGVKRKAIVYYPA